VEGGAGLTLTDKRAEFDGHLALAQIGLDDTL